MSRLSRADASLLGRWWWSVDRPNVAILAIIIVIGAVVLMAAGPSASSRMRIANEFHFPMKQFVFLGPALFVMLSVSFLTPLQTRRLGVIVFAGMLVLMLSALLFGGDINGAKRWVDFGVIGIQPSEFAKPGFVIAAAWMIAEGARDPKFPGGAMAMAFYAIFATLLLLQPDYGQWALMTGVWAMMFFIAGWSWLWIVVLGIVGVGALIAGYQFSDHVASRIDSFLDPASGETFQVDRALETIANGGFIGRGDAPSVKGHLPDAHTDFIFAVAAEEFGFILGLTIIVLFAVFVTRTLFLASAQRSVFIQTSVAGLAATIGFQAMINVGVSLRALPAKGMTLPFISYGGSSLLATALTIGFIFSLTRTHSGVWRRKDVMP